MSELMRRTGVQPGTVRHYLRLGLLPPPQRVAANRFLYDRRHEQALKLVRLLRERRHLPLSEIRRVLPGLTGMADQQAFRADMWEELVEAQLSAGTRRGPAARLLRAGMEAFNRHGFAEVRVDDLCRSARVAKGSFYRHYRSKEDLFFAAAAAAGDEAARAFEGDGSGLSEGEAEVALSSALARRLPLLLDLLALAAQRRPGHARVAREVFSTLRAAVRSRLGPPADEDTGQRVLGAALLTGIRQLTVAPAAASVVDGKRATGP